MSKYDEEWGELRLHYRRSVNRVLKDIRNGTVSELDLDKLHNFCQDCFMLMSKVPMAVWRKAEKDADLAGLLKDITEKEDEIDTIDDSNSDSDGIYTDQSL